MCVNAYEFVCSQVSAVVDLQLAPYNCGYCFISGVMLRCVSCDNLLGIARALTVVAILVCKTVVYHDCDRDCNVIIIAISLFLYVIS